MAVTDDHLQGGLSVDAHQPTPKIMTIPPTPTSRFRREDRDTGFPEPFGESELPPPLGIILTSSTDLH